MNMDWKSWCRFCGKTDVHRVDILNIDYDTVPILTEAFSLKIFIDEKFPIIICPDCQKFANEMDLFRKRSVRVNKMFSEMVSAIEDGQIVNVKEIRSKHRIDGKSRRGHEAHRNLTIKEFENDSDCSDTTVIYRDPRNINAIKTDFNLSVTSTSGLCSEEFTDEQVYREHLRDKQPGNKPLPQALQQSHVSTRKTTTQKRIHICDECDKSFDRKYDLEDHAIVHGGFKCPKCPKRLKSMKGIKNHEKTHISTKTKIKEEFENDSNCSDTTVIYRDPPNTNEIKADFNLSFTSICDLCSEEFTDEQIYKQHLKDKHPPNKPLPPLQQSHVSTKKTKIQKSVYICDECDESFDRKYDLEDHAMVHGGFKCPKCPKRLKSIKGIKNHEKTHSSTSFQCYICEAQLNTFKLLNRHCVEMHFEDSKYICKTCGAIFKRKRTLTHHIKTQHP